MGKNKKKRQESPPSGPDESRKGPSRQRSPSEDEDNHRRPASPKPVGRTIADILGNITRKWEIEVQTHLPLHLDNCEECSRFVQHVVDYSKGGLDGFVDLQRRHWIDELDRMFQSAHDDGYDKAAAKAKVRESSLMTTIEDLRTRVLDLERGQSFAPPMMESTPPPTKKEQKRARPPSMEEQFLEGERPSEGKRPKSSKESSQEPRAPKPAPKPSSKGKGKRKQSSDSESGKKVRKRTMYNTSSGSSTMTQRKKKRSEH